MANKALRDCAKAVLLIDNDGNIIGVIGSPVVVSLENDLSDVLGRVGILVGGEDLGDENPLPVSDAGGNLSIDFGGVVAQLDDTDKLAVSVYGTNEQPGDTAIRLNDGRQLYVVQDDTFDAMLDELKKISFQLALMTGTHLGSEDVEA